MGAQDNMINRKVVELTLITRVKGRVSEPVSQPGEEENQPREELRRSLVHNLV